MAVFSTLLKRVKEVLAYYAGGLYRQLDKKDVFLWAQAIAFKVLITIVPVTILAAGIMGLVLQREKPLEAVTAFLQDFLPTYQLESLLAILRAFSSAGNTLTLIGAFGLLFSALTLFTTLRVAVSNIFQEEWHETRSILGGYLFDLRMVGQVGLFFLLTLGLSIFMQTIDTVGVAYMKEAGLDYVWVLRGWRQAFKALGVLVPLLLTTAMFFQLFFFIPKPAPPKRSAFFGALITAALWELAKFGFTLYATYVGRFDRYSGAGPEGTRAVVGDTFGLIVAFVFWIYYSGIVLCLGAIMALLHEKRHRSRRAAAVAEAEAEALEAEATAPEAPAAEAPPADVSPAAEAPLEGPPVPVPSADVAPETARPAETTEASDRRETPEATRENLSVN